MVTAPEPKNPGRGAFFSVCGKFFRKATGPSMGLPLIDEFLAGESTEIRDLSTNEAALVGFLTLAKQIDDLPDVRSRFYEQVRSLYQVTASKQSMGALMDLLTGYFGAPVKAPGKPVPAALRFAPTVKHLGGIRKDQALFLKKTKTGAFYGALWPWQHDVGKIEIHLGFCSPSMDPADYRRLGTLVNKFLSQKKMEAISSVGGQLHGISLPSFLQMSEMEGASYTLKVISGTRTGYLYLDDGNLIAAGLEGLTGAPAAYRIISWDNVAIQIEAADTERRRDIHEPLMHVMMESLKIKDESGAATDSESSDHQIHPSSESVAAPPPAPGHRVDEAEQSNAAAPTLGSPAHEAAPQAASEADGPETPPTSGIVFDRAIDQSAGRQGQMSRWGKLLIALGVVILVAAGVIGGHLLIEQHRIDRRYDRLVADLAVASPLDARIVLIMKFLNAHPGTLHQSALEARLNELHAELQKQDYEQTISQVGDLPIDDQYEPKALSLYTAFLKKHPDSPYTEQVNEAIGGIGPLLGSVYFEDLKKAASTDVVERISAYRAYLKRFPQSPRREAVQAMIDAAAAAYADAIHQQVGTCDAQSAWDDCLAQCDRFLALFPSGLLSETVTTLRSTLQDKADVVGLDARAALAADDMAQARTVYTDYLAQRPDTSQRALIGQRIDRLEAALAEADVWRRTAAFAADSSNDIFKRIERLDAFVQDHADGPYAVPAGKLRAKLASELTAAVQARDAQAQQRARRAAQQAQRDRLLEEERRRRGLQAQVAAQLGPVATRFVGNADGTVTDRVTGLTWCQLDSFLDLGRCITYRSAKAYVQTLTTGGHSDWRLPTAGELAAIYKNSPFFPGSGAPWYWTSESFARGYHRVVDVVTSAPETVFTRVSKSEDRCGAVRAVR